MGKQKFVVSFFSKLSNSLCEARLPRLVDSCYYFCKSSCFLFLLTNEIGCVVSLWHSLGALCIMNKTILHVPFKIIFAKYPLDPSLKTNLFIKTGFYRWIHYFSSPEPKAYMLSL